MPELPDIAVYVEALDRRITERRLERLRIASPFLLRSVRPAAADAEGRKVEGVRRLGKRIVLALDGGIFAVLHLMIAGASVPAKIGLAAFDFRNGTLLLTESGGRKRASLHLVEGEDALASHDPGGIEVLGADHGAFAQALRRERHTVKRALTDPRLVSGIGNA